jgi:hypothetical protein
MSSIPKISSTGMTVVGLLGESESIKPSILRRVLNVVVGAFLVLGQFVTKWCHSGNTSAGVRRGVSITK